MNIESRIEKLSAESDHIHALAAHLQKELKSYIAGENTEYLFDLLTNLTGDHSFRLSNMMDDIQK